MKKMIALCLAFVLMMSTFISAFAAETETTPEDGAAAEEGENIAPIEGGDAAVEGQTEATSGTCGENLTWTLTEDGTLTISGNGAMERDENGWYSWFDWIGYINRVIISEGVSNIGDYAFSGCMSLSSIEIPEGVTSIGKGAFDSCEYLGNVKIPASVTSIGEGAFSGCYSLEFIEVASGNKNYASEDGVLFNNGKTTLIEYPQAKKGDYVIPDGVVSIDPGSFNECYYLSNIVIPGSVTSVGDDAFIACSGLASVTLSDGVKNIGNYAFSYCDSLSSIAIPGSVTDIGDVAFGNCENLSNVTLSEGVENIGSDAFINCPGLAGIVLPASIKSIGEHAIGCVGEEHFAGSGGYYHEYNYYAVKDGFIISGYSGSEAQRYADDNSIPFKAIDGEIPDSNVSNTYVVEPGASSLTYLLTSGGNVTIYCTGELKNFVRLLVDGQVVDPKYYDLAEGSTVLTLHSEFLETLAPGDHPATLEYTDGTAECMIKIIEKEPESETKAPETQASGTNSQNNGTSGGSGNANTGSGSADTGTPRTGDDTNLPLWFAVLFLSMTGGSFALGVKRKYKI